MNNIRSKKELIFQGHEQSKFDWGDSEVIPLLHVCSGNKKRRKVLNFFYVLH